MVSIHTMVSTWALHGAGSGITGQEGKMQRCRLHEGNATAARKLNTRRMCLGSSLVSLRDIGLPDIPAGRGYSGDSLCTDEHFALAPGNGLFQTRMEIRIRDVAQLILRASDIGKRM